MRYNFKKLKNNSWPVLALVAVSIIIILLGESQPLNENIVKMSSCIDGDTARVVLKDQEVKLRFLAGDTPELSSKDYYAREAADYTCNRLLSAKEIVLEFDPLADEEDKFGRKLAWVFVDGELLQEELVDKGYARVRYIYDDYKYVDRLKRLEKNARRNQIGVWAN